MNTAFCPNCESVCAVRTVRKPETFKVRGMDITVDVEFVTCDVCGTEFDLPDAADPLIEVYRVYREKKNLVQPEEIRTFRKMYGITQIELSRLLGWGGATLSRYENGALQDEAHDRALRLIMERDNLLSLLEQHSDVLPAQKREKLIARIQREGSNTEDLYNDLQRRVLSYPPTEKSGYRSFSITKFVNAVLYFCGPEGVARTKLNKLLWYADFLHFKRHSVSITGARYAHLPYGPVPNNYNTLFTYFEEYTGDLRTEERSYNDYTWEEYVAVSTSDKNVFEDTELRVLMDVKSHFENRSASSISEFSHEEKGYKETDNGELISYEYATALQI